MSRSHPAGPAARRMHADLYGDDVFIELEDRAGRPIGHAKVTWVQWLHLADRLLDDKEMQRRKRT